MLALGCKGSRATGVCGLRSSKTTGTAVRAMGLACSCESAAAKVLVDRMLQDGSFEMAMLVISINKIADCITTLP